MCGREIDYISIHAPREGGDESWWRRVGQIFGFQSTPPARGATCDRMGLDAADRLISIHAPREGGDVMADSLQTVCVISIHAPREGGDGAACVLPGL